MPSKHEELELPDSSQLKSFLGNLIIASKQGNITSALLWLGQINSLNHIRPGSVGGVKDDDIVGVQPLTLHSIQYVFRPSESSPTPTTKTTGTGGYDKKKQHSPFLHAVLKGHHDLVEYYLSLYLIYATKISFTTINKNQSFQEWFLQLNNTANKKGKKVSSKKKNKQASSSSSYSSQSSFFNHFDFDQCVVQSNNEDVRDVMTRKNIDIPYAMKVVDQASFSCVPYETLIQPRMKEIYLNVKNVTNKQKEKMSSRSQQFSHHDNDESSDSDSDYQSCISYSEESYTIIENPNHNFSSTISIRYVNVENDLVSVEVEVCDEKMLNTNTASNIPTLEYLSKESIDSDVEKSSTYNLSDDNSLMKSESFLSRATWLRQSFSNVMQFKQ